MSAREKITDKQERAIVALLNEPALAAAAARAGVGEATLRRWFAQSSAFVSAYRAARRQMLDDALLVAQKAAKAAVACLLRNLRCGKPSAEIRAAEAILAHVVRAGELLDLASEIDELKRRVK